MNIQFSKLALVLSIVFGAFLSGCAAVESKREISGDQVATYNTNYSGPKATLVVGSFDNRSDYLRGIFSGNADRLGGQAKTILKTHLQQTNRFKLVDRENLEGIAKEASIAGISQSLAGAEYLVSGAVTEFGRKNTGDKQFFGVLGSGKTQTAYSKVSLNIVDVKTSEIVFSVQGAGEYSLSEREVLGFGSDASYDATLNGKVLNFAVTRAVDELVKAIESGKWRVN